MAWRLVLLAALVGTAIAAVPTSAVASNSDCGRAGAIAGCPNVSGAASDNVVVLEGSESHEGRSNGSVATAPPRWFDYSMLIGCVTASEVEACVGDAAEAQPITIRDIASFIPTPGRQQMQPDGWTVAGLDTNFYAITQQHVVPGTLLGRPADVRFTPTAFHWNYGDGTAATKPTKGGTWEALGLDEFEPTPTSHVYEQLGDYTITLSITFTAEYRFDGSAWRGVVGNLTLPANDLYLRVGTAKTVLVEHDCLANPSGPGC
jgi:hypothetical protein